MEARARIVVVVTMTPLLAVLLLATRATPAHASCAAEHEEAIARQGTVFLATAVEQTYRYARVEVDEIWRGPDLAPTVWLQTSPVEVPPWPLSLVLRSATSVDAQLVPGTRYLIATEDDGFRTNSCLVAEASRPFVDRVAPEAAREPVASGATGDGPGILEGTSGIALAVSLIVALPVGGWLAHRRFRADPRADRT